MDESQAVARELASAYADAVEAGDADGIDYAAEQIEDFLGEIDDGTDTAVLVELLDLPLDETTLPLLDQVGAMLRRRGPAVLEPLLSAVAGEGPPDLSVADMLTVAGAVGALLEAATGRPHSSPRVQNALSVMAAMDERDLILGLIEVLEGRADDRLKQVASDTLVGIGQPALDELRLSRRDRDAEPWVSDALVEIEARSRDAADYDSAGGDWETQAGQEAVDPAADDSIFDEPAGGSFDEPADDACDEPADGEGPSAEALDGDAEASGDDASSTGAEPGEPGLPATAAPSAGPADAAPGVPGADRIDEDYQAFLERFKRETGQR